MIAYVKNSRWKIMKIGLVALLHLSSVPVNAHEFQNGYSRSEGCSKTVYREEYIAGTLENQGYVKRWQETIPIPCNKHVSHHHHYQPQYSVSSTPITPIHRCNAARTTTGGLLGGGLAAAISEKDAYSYSIPLGAVIGMGIANSDC